MNEELIIPISPSADVDPAAGRMQGCQSTNHTNCYGELWRCAICGKIVCFAEGSSHDPELCDDCWMRKYGWGPHTP